MEENKVERDLMNLEEFKQYLAENRGIMTMMAFSKYKSVFRAIRRGHVTTTGYIIPKRPFNNRANTSERKGVHSRAENELKKQIYGRVK